MKTQTSNQTIKLQNQRVLVLLATIVVVVTGTRLTRAEEPKPEEKKKWESVAAIGITLSRGNSQNFMATGTINSSRKWEKDELLLGGSAGYGETTTRNPGQPSETSKTDDYIKGFSQWNHLITERFYAGLRFSAEHDDIADLDYRFTLSPLVGYYFIKTTNAFLSGEIGPSGIYEKQGGREDTYVALRLAERGEYKFKSGAKIWESVEWLPQIDDFENWILNAELGISAPISKALDVRLVLQDTYDNRPASGRLKNDLKLIAGIGYKF
jgi:putative salt-induced outer membrane protein YdiY